MKYVFIGEQWLLDYLSKETSESPEALLIRVEELHISGEYSLEEIRQLLADIGIKLGDYDPQRRN